MYLRKMALPIRSFAALAVIHCLFACDRRKTPEQSRQAVAPPMVYSIAANCAASGGKIEKVGMAQTQACIHLFPDRGKQCQGKSECEGECRYVDDTRPIEAKNVNEEEARWATRPGTEVVGACQWSDDQFGCRSTVQDGKIKEAICVD